VPASSPTRFTLAVTAVFALFGGAYAAAVRWPTTRLASVRTSITFLTGNETASTTPVVAAATRAADAASLSNVARLPERPPLPAATQLGYHRYVGTIGGRPVLAELNWYLKQPLYAGDTRPITATLDGTFYYRDTGQDGTLGTAYGAYPTQWLETYYYTSPDNQPVAMLCAEQPPGPLLTGWYTPYGERQALPVHLRESYQDGVRYELLHEQTTGRPGRHFPSSQPNKALVEQTYLHLLGSDTLRPALARLQCPPPAARRRARRVRLANLGPGDDYQEKVEVTFNAVDILSIQRFATLGNNAIRTYDEQIQQVLVDLRTGRTLSLAGQLHPGGLRQVKHLLTRQALADTTAASQRDYWWRGGQLPLPAKGLVLRPDGWVAAYKELDYEQDLHGYHQTLSWAALYPLLPLGSPLRRLRLGR
jgi:hypothetical protein